MPQVYLYATASRLILAGCRCRKTLLRTPRARERGVSSCLTRRTDFQTSVLSACLSALISSAACVLTARAPSANAVTGLFLAPFVGSEPPAPFPGDPFVPFPSGILIPQRFSDPDDGASIVK